MAGKQSGASLKKFFLGLGGSRAAPHEPEVRGMDLDLKSTDSVKSYDPR